MSGKLSATQMPNQSNATAEPDITTLGDQTWFKILKYSLYSIIFVISLVGNIMVCYVVSRRMKMKTVTNYFIMNLAIADLLYTLCIPLDVYATESSHREWPYGSFMCRVLYPAQTLTMTVSGFTLTALSATRYWAVVNPLKRQLNTTQSLIMIILLWFMAAITVIPYIKYLGIVESGICEDDWPNVKPRQIYTASLFVIQYAIPLSIILMCYIRIGLELTKGPVTYNRMLAKARGKEAKKVIKMLVIVTLTFAILTLPSSIMWMWSDFGNADKFTSFYDIMDVLYILDFLNSATNPIIYSFCNESFSREFRRQLGCLHPPPPSETESGRCTSFVAMVSPSPTSNDNGKSKCNGDCTTLL